MLASYENGMDDLGQFVVFAEKFDSKQPPKNEQMWEVLIVDDEKDVHRMTKMVLRNYSFLGQKINFHSAYSASEAIEFLESNSNIALVLLDVVMEEKNAGLKLVEYIRQELENEAIRIIIRTGQPGEAPEETVIRDYVINDYIEKGDITTRRLYTTITTSLRGYTDLIALRDSVSQLKELSKRLERAYKRLEALDKEKAKIIQFMYHELLTPLNHVGASQVFDISSLTVENQRILEMVTGGFTRLDGLIKAFLDYFEFMSSELSVQTSPIPLQNEITSILELFKADVRKKNLKIVLGISESDTIHFDPNYFGVVLKIVVDNAIKHSNPYGVVTISHHTTETDVCQLIVEDSGVGIATENIEKIFQAYDLEDYHRREGGFGLNLPKARYIVESHNGKIWAESEGLSQGSRFIIEL